MTPFVALFLALCSASPSSTAQESDRVRAWTEDVEFLARELERLHPEPFYSVPRLEFEAALDAFRGQLEGWNDERVTAELLRLVALISRGGMDGHTAIWPMEARYLPVQLHGFADGWFVVGASGAHASLVGARVLALDGEPIARACERLAPFLSKDNEWNLRLRMGLALTLPALLRGAGIGSSEERTSLRLALRDGTETEVRVEAERRANIRPWGGAFARSLPPAGTPLWLQDRERAFWMRVLEDQPALYVQYSAVLPKDEAGRTLTDFAAEIVRTFHERGLERVILDVRSNAGGDSSTFGPLVAALRSDSAINRRGALFLLVGRATFSAGGNFAAVLRKETEVLLVGEPAGGAPNHFGDAEEIALPHHPDFYLRISTRRHVHAGEGEDPLLLLPDLPVSLDSSEYFAGVDPVLRVALEHRAQ